ncbi:MAG: ClpXP protease specificity-enhancing factor SspB [Pseudomonadota bacterium]
MVETIRYGQLMHRAMRGLIQNVLTIVEQNGTLPGGHHFFVTFETVHPDVKLAGWLRDRYPKEMTVVIQHWFKDLEVDDDGFSITLNFGDIPEALYIPYDAIQTFVDPSVEFGLRFESQEDEDEGDDRDEEDEAPMVEEAEEQDTHEGDAEIVSLDSFRK